MDCYIVRVYRHIIIGDGKTDEIAGLVEHVGQHDSSRPFSSYQSLISAMRGDGKAADPALAEVGDPGIEAASRLRVVHPAKGG